MDEDSKFVRVPEDMYRQIEKRAMRCTLLEEILIDAGRGLQGYQITAVITNPPSRDAERVLKIVQALANAAGAYQS